MERRFFDIVDRVKSNIVLREVVERLELRYIEGAIAALHLDAEAFYPLKEALREAFNAGGTLTVGSLPRLSDPLVGRVVVRWDASNQAAETVIRDLQRSRASRTRRTAISAWLRL